MEHWLDGDKWDQVGKYTESDFEEDINNIHYDKTMLLAAHMGKLVKVFFYQSSIYVQPEINKNEFD